VENCCFFRWSCLLPASGGTRMRPPVLPAISYNLFYLFPSSLLPVQRVLIFFSSLRSAASVRRLSSSPLYPRNSCPKFQDAALRSSRAQCWFRFLYTPRQLILCTPGHHMTGLVPPAFSCHCYLWLKLAELARRRPGEDIPLSPPYHSRGGVRPSQSHSSFRPPPPSPFLPSPFFFPVWTWTVSSFFFFPFERVVSLHPHFAIGKRESLRTFYRVEPACCPVSP